MGGIICVFIKIKKKSEPKTGKPFENIDLEASSYKKRGKKKSSDEVKTETIIEKEEIMLDKSSRV